MESNSKRLILLACFFWVFLLPPVSMAAGTPPSSRDIPDGEFFETVAQAIAGARESITVVLTYFSLPDTDPEDPVYKALQSLILAHLEGLKVHLVLNRPYHFNMDLFTSERHPNAAWDLVRSAQIPVTFISSSHAIHFNLILIDDRVVIESTIPWTTGIDFEGNHFSSTLIADPSLVLAKKNKVVQLGIQDFQQKQASEVLGRHFSVQSGILTHRNLSLFFRQRDEPVFQTYLLLAAETQGRGPEGYRVSFQRMANRLFKENHPQILTVKKISGILRYLERRMKLIDIREDQRQIQAVSLKESTEPVFPLPANLVRMPFIKTLAPEALVLYCYAAKSASDSGTFPEWRIDPSFQKSLPRELREQLDSWMQVLEKHRMIEPVLSAESLLPDPSPPAFRLLPLKDPVQSQREMRSLMKSYPDDLVQKAMFMASQMHLEQDPEIIRDFCYFLSKLGFLEVQKIVHTIYSLPAHHPQRSYDQMKFFLLQTLQMKIQPG